MDVVEDNSDIDNDEMERDNDDVDHDSDDYGDDDDDDTAESEADSEDSYHVHDDEVDPEVFCNDYDYRDKLRRNDPRIGRVKICGFWLLQDITQLGICLQGNTNVRHLDLCFTISDWYKWENAGIIEIRLALEDAFQGFYNFVESCRVLKRLKVDLGNNTQLDVVDNFLYRMSRRAYKYPPLPGVQQVI